MKSIFSCLLILNFVFVIYFIFRQPEYYKLESGSYEDPTIQLLSERKDLLAKQKEAILANPILGFGNSNILDCLGFGPFEDIDLAQEIANRIISAGYQVTLRAVDEATKVFDYRVFLPAANSVQEAYRRLRKLKSRGIDGYVMSGGENSLTISLGVFPTIEAAADHRLKFLEKGYDVEIKEIPRFVRGYWILTDNSFDFSSVEIKSIAKAGWIEATCFN